MTRVVLREEEKHEFRIDWWYHFTLIGVAGGVVGTYFSIKNTSGPRGRTFMIKVSLVAWVAILLFLALLFALPSPYRWFLFIPYGILLPLGIMYGNKTQQRIADEESQNN